MVDRDRIASLFFIVGFILCTSFLYVKYVGCSVLINEVGFEKVAGGAEKFVKNGLIVDLIMGNL